MKVEQKPASQLSSSPHAISKLQLEHSVLQQATSWLQELLGIVLPADTPSNTLFSDCWLLGRVADVLQAALAGEVPAHRPLPPQQATRRRADVINDFVRWQTLCAKLGVSRDQLPLLADMEQGRGVTAVCCCLWAAADRAAALGLAVPGFGGATARANLRRCMTRQDNAKRAELFVSTDDSPLKLPSLPLLTPRAFHGRPGSPAPRGPTSGLCDSNSSLHGWLHRGNDHKGDGQQLEQQGQDRDQRGRNGGLQPTIAAMELAAAEAARQSRCLDGGGGGGSTSLQQCKRHPVLLPLDVQAAAAAATTPAAEEEKAVAVAAVPAAASPLSSPGTNVASPMMTHSSSSCQTSGYAGSSPEPSPSRHRLTPNTLRQDAKGNPLWIAFPSSLPPTPAADCKSASDGAQHELLELWQAQAQAPAQGAPPLQQFSASTTVTAGAPKLRFEQPETGSDALPVQRQLLHWDGEEDEPELAGGYGCSLLESILSPLHVKPAHSQLLGALMHASGGVPAAAAPWQQRSQQQQELEGHEKCDGLGEPAATAAHLLEEKQQLPQAAPEQQMLEHCPSVPACAASVAVAEEHGNASGSSASHRGSSSSSNGLRKAALLFLGTVVGAAAAAAAGAVQQRRQPPRRSACRLQPVPLHSESRTLQSEQQRVLRGGGRARGSDVGAIRWDSPEAITITRG